MLDQYMRPIIDPPLNHIGKAAARARISANMVTATGLVIGLFAAVAIACEAYILGLILILASRLCDGLDGAVARASRPTDFGGYFDIVADFLFYGAIPFGFAIAVPENAVIATFLILSFYVNGASFLGYSVLAERFDMETEAQGKKTLFYSNGILEGTETILFFVLITLLPSYFVYLASLFAILTFATALLRMIGAYQHFNMK